MAQLGSSVRGADIVVVVVVAVVVAVVLVVRFLKLVSYTVAGDQKGEKKREKKRRGEEKVGETVSQEPIRSTAVTTYLLLSSSFQTRTNQAQPPQACRTAWQLRLEQDGLLLWVQGSMTEMEEVQPVPFLGKRHVMSVIGGPGKEAQKAAVSGYHWRLSLKFSVRYIS